MAARTDPRLVSWLQSFSRVASATAILAGSLVLVGWILDIATLKSVLPTLVTMKANTAVAFILAGVSLRLAQIERADQRTRRIERACAFTVALVGLLTLAEYLFGLDLGIDQLLFKEPWGAVATSQPGRMSPNTALTFLLVGCALLLLDLETRRGHRPAQFLALAAAAIALRAMVGYAYDLTALYGIASYTKMAIHTAVTFLVLCVGTLFARPDRGVMAVLSSQGPGGVMARRLLVPAVGIPVVLGWLKLEGRRAGFSGTEFGLSLVVALTVIIFTVAIWWTAESLDRSDAEREQALEDTRRLKEEQDAASHNRLARLEALIEVGRAVTATLDVDEVLALVVDKSVQVVGVDAAVILAVDPQKGSLRVVRGRGVPSDFLAAFTLAPGEGVPGAALQGGHPVWTYDMLADPRLPLPEALRTLVAAEGIRATLAVPIRTGSGTYGVLALYRRDAQPFGSDQVRFATIFADQAGTAIDTARLQEQRLTEIVALSEALRKLDITQPMEAFYRDLAEIARQAVGARYAALGILGPDGHMAQFVPVGLTDEEVRRIGPLPRGVGLLGHMLRTPRPLRLDDLEKHPQSIGFPAHHPRMQSFLGTRIVFQDRVIGALYLTERARGPFTPSDEKLVEAFAANAAVAIANARAYQEIQEARRELERASHHKSEFLASMSHELRTPLHSILGFAEILLGDRFGTLAERQREFVGEIQEGGTHLLGLINDVLDLARVEAGRVSLTREHLSLADALAAVEGTVTVLAQQKGMTITRAVEPGLTLAWADPTRFRQILYNLLSNAIKFTPQWGRVTIGARKRAGISDFGFQISDLRERTTDDGLPTTEFIEISVADTGIGIAPEDQVRIFEAFEQVQTTGLDKLEGTGLGLALTKRLVELHGGTIRVESAERGQGATFTFTLPWRPPATSRRILVVEDDDVVREGLREHLVAEGYQVDEAARGDEGLAAALARPPDLVLLDIGLPGMDGRQVLAALRENPATAQIPVITLTGITDVRAEDLLAEGANEFLTKPFSLSVLSGVIRGFLEPH